MPRRLSRSVSMSSMDSEDEVELMLTSDDDESDSEDMSMTTEMYENEVACTPLDNDRMDCSTQVLGNATSINLNGYTGMTNSHATYTPHWGNRQNMVTQPLKHTDTVLFSPTYHSRNRNKENESLQRPFTNFVCPIITLNDDPRDLLSGSGPGYYDDPVQYTGRLAIASKLNHERKKSRSAPIQRPLIKKSGLAPGIFTARRRLEISERMRFNVMLDIGASISFRTEISLPVDNKKNRKLRGKVRAIRAVKKEISEVAERAIQVAREVDIHISRYSRLIDMLCGAKASLAEEILYCSENNRQTSPSFKANYVRYHQLAAEALKLSGDIFDNYLIDDAISQRSRRALRASLNKLAEVGKALVGYRGGWPLVHELRKIEDLQQARFSKLVEDYLTYQPYRYAERHGCVFRLEDPVDTK